MFKSQSGQSLIITIFIIILILTSAMLVGGLGQPKTNTDGRTLTKLMPVPVSPNKSKNSLQLNTFSFVTPAPPPTTAPTRSPFCGSDDGVCRPLSEQVCCPNYAFFCSNGTCTGEGKIGGGLCTYYSNPATDKICQTACGNKDGFVCVGKPVIYLYPEKPIKVNVSIKTSGKIIASNPKYPVTGWQGIEAFPNGSFFYEGKRYKELFYESEVGNFSPPQNGLIISYSQIDQQLENILYRLGLNSSESGEFLDFWVPKLKALNSNYILFSLINTSKKEQIDKVVITPEPKTRIEFIVYFKPLSYPIAVRPLKLPPRPQRIGFTMVEWGGTIDTNYQTSLLQ